MKQIGCYFIGLLAIVSFFIVGCKDDEATSGNLTPIQFETDTLRFDTVFTTTKTITKGITVFNNSDEPLLVDKIFLQGKSDYYSINISGVPNSITNYRIEANDSLFIFVEANIDAQNRNNPFIVEDNIVFQSGAQQKVIALEAYGQDAFYVGSKTQTKRITCAMGREIFNSQKPYVIFGSLEVDSCILEIPAGQELFFHGSAFVDGEAVNNDGFLRIKKEGRLEILGTADQPVTLRSDRRDDVFDGRAGQWAGLYFEKQSELNHIQYCKIQDGVVNITLEDSTDLVIENTTLENAFYQNILVQNAKLKATNTLIYGSNNSSNVKILNGGDYSLEYVTISSVAKDRNFAQAIDISNEGCFNILDCEETNPLLLRINNSIIFGSKTDEITFDLDDELLNDILITNSMVKTVDTMDYYQDSKFNITPSFVNSDENEFELDSTSLLITCGIPNTITIDLLGTIRRVDSTSLGAIEYQEAVQD